MGVTEALEEALERWGEAAAIHKDGSRRTAHYQVGYFSRRGDGLEFHAMGGGASLEQALAKAHEVENHRVVGAASSFYKEAARRP